MFTKKKISFIIFGLILINSILLVDASSHFVGNKNSDVYHYPSCYYVDNIKPDNLIYFNTPEETIAADYRPCKVCDPPDSSTPISTPPFTLTGEWIKKANTSQSGGFGEALIGANNYIFVARCMFASSTPYFWRYDSSTNNWDFMNTSGLPIGAFRNGATLTWDHSNYIYSLLGGRYEDNRILFYRYSISSDKWEKLIDTPHAQGAGDAITWSGYDNKIYAIVGSNEHGTVFAYYTPTDYSWTTLPFYSEWTEADDGASLIWTGGEYIYALQGECQDTVPNQDFVRFHIPTKTWNDMNPIPETEGVGDGASLLWIDEYPDIIFALGGGSFSENPGYNFYSYSISQNQWNVLESIPCPVGKYNGNRLGFIDEHIYYWQGAPSTWDCNGDAFYKLVFENQPIADPNGPYTSTEGVLITFDGFGSSDPDGNIVSYAWDFGDGNTGTGVDPTHTYIQDGIYTVTLTVTNNDAATNQASTTTTISDTEPTADFKGTPTSGFEPFSVSFIDTSTSYDGITLWKWDFNNDGTIDSDEQNPTHTYTEDGIYTITLKVYE